MYFFSLVKDFGLFKEYIKIVVLVFWMVIFFIGGNLYVLEVLMM